MTPLRRWMRFVPRPWVFGSRIALVLGVVFIIFAVQQFLVTEADGKGGEAGASTRARAGQGYGGRPRTASAAGAPAAPAASGASKASRWTWLLSWFGGGGAGGAAAGAKGRTTSGARTGGGLLQQQQPSQPQQDQTQPRGQQTQEETGGGGNDDEATGWSPAEVEALRKRVDTLRKEVEAAQRERNEQLGQLGAVEVARLVYEQGEVERDLSPKERFRKLQKTLIVRTQETVEMHAYMNRLRDEIESRIRATAGAQACQLMQIGSYSQGWLVSEALVAGSPPEVEVLSFGIGKELSFDLDLIAAFLAAKRDVRIHAIDPDPRSIEWAERQRLTKRLLLHEVALATADGPADFWQLARRSGTTLDNRFSKTKDEDVQIKVTGKTLATLKHDLNVGRTELVKMDIQGFEYAIVEQLGVANVNASHLLIDMHTGTNDVLPDIFASATAALKLLAVSGWRLLAVDERHGRKFTLVRTCTPAVAEGGRGDCLCCYPDVSFYCVLAV